MQEGEKVGRLTAVQLLKVISTRRTNYHLWKFRCDCGAEEDRLAELVYQSFNKGRSPSCKHCRRKGIPPRTEPKRLDIAGQKIGKLTALEPTGRVDKKRYAIWRFQCECGEIVERSASAVINQTNHKHHPANCGKSSCNNYRRGEFGASIKKSKIDSYRRMAKYRDLAFELSDQEVEKLLQGNCHYCGKEPSSVAKKIKMYGYFVYNGIDRVDNTKGYIPGNVVSCCRKCNYAKNAMTYEEFMEWIAQLIAYQTQK